MNRCLDIVLADLSLDCATNGRRVSGPTQIAGRKREVADETKFLRHEEADLHLLQSGKNRTRTYISMNQAGASTFERAVDASCRGQHDEHNRKASGATSDTPGLVARMKSLFD